MPESDVDLFRRALQRCFITWRERDLADVTDLGGQECLGDQWSAGQEEELWEAQEWRDTHSRLRATWDGAQVGTGCARMLMLQVIGRKLPSQVLATTEMHHSPSFPAPAGERRRHGPPASGGVPLVPRCFHALVSPLCLQEFVCLRIYSP